MPACQTVWFAIHLFPKPNYYVLLLLHSQHVFLKKCSNNVIKAWGAYSHDPDDFQSLNGFDVGVLVFNDLGVSAVPVLRYKFNWWLIVIGRTPTRSLFTYCNGIVRRRRRARYQKAPAVATVITAAFDQRLVPLQHLHGATDGGQVIAALAGRQRRL